MARRLDQGLRSTPARHDDVSSRTTSGWAPFRIASTASSPEGGGHHGIAQVAQDLRRHVSDRLLVVHDEHRPFGIRHLPPPIGWVPSRLVHRHAEPVT